MVSQKSKSSKGRIVFKDGDKLFRLSTVFFGSDGSYYATIPYHNSGKALICKVPINYAEENDIKFSEFLDVGQVEEKKIKMSHHPDGFVQFSGEGVLSGRNHDGDATGMGVISSPLNKIFDGPSFNYSIQNINSLEQVDKLPSNSILFDLSENIPIQKTDSICVEAHYFVPMWRRFIRFGTDGQPYINILHPCGAVLHLRVFLAPSNCEIPGFLGFELYRIQLSLPENGYSFSTPTGNIREDENGQTIADELFCIYPKYDVIKVQRSLNYPQQPIK